MTLLIAEGIVRYSGVVDMQLQCKFIDHELFKHNSYFEKKSLCDEYSTIGYDRSDVIQTLLPKEGKHLNINEDGFRGEELDLQDNNYNIFFLGGSTTFGVISSNDFFTIPALLEKKFTDDGLNIKVINAGIPNSNSRDERYYFEKYIIQYSPNMVIMYDGWNDMVPLEDDLTYAEFTNQPYYINHMTPIDNITNTGILTFLAKIDYKTGLGVAKSVSNLIHDTNIKKLDNFSQEHLLEIEERLQDNWSNECKLGQKNNITMINILQPILGTGNRTLTEFESFSEVEFYNPYLWKFKLNNEKYAPCESIYDLRNVFDSVGNMPIFFDNGHTTDFGNKIIAEKIYEKILPTVLEDLSK